MLRSRHLAVAATAGALALAGPAYAHPKLLSSSPAANGTAEAPSQLSLVFGEKLMPRLSGMDVVMTGMPGMLDHKMNVTGFQTAVTEDGKTLVATFPKPLTAGAYQVKWHAVSIDTHRVEGQFVFSVP